MCSESLPFPLNLVFDYKLSQQGDFDVMPMIIMFAHANRDSAQTYIVVSLISIVSKMR